MGSSIASACGVEASRGLIACLRAQTTSSIERERHFVWQSCRTVSGDPKNRVQLSAAAGGVKRANQDKASGTLVQKSFLNKTAYSELLSAQPRLRATLPKLGLIFIWPYPQTCRADFETAKGNRRTRRDSNAQSSAPEADALSIRPRVLKKIDRSLGDLFQIRQIYTSRNAFTLYTLAKTNYILQVCPHFKAPTVQKAHDSLQCHAGCIKTRV